MYNDLVAEIKATNYRIDALRDVILRLQDEVLALKGIPSGKAPPAKPL